MKTEYPNRESLVVSDSEASWIKSYLKKFPTWNEAEKVEPRFFEAVEALPDTSKIYKTNILIMTMLMDSICRAKHIPDGSLDHLLPDVQ